MPSISKTELAKLRNKEGVYSNLRDTAKIQTVKQYITKNVETAFRVWAKQHRGCTPDIEEKSWQKFNEVLQKYL